jgi:hypothetical protein
LDPLTEVRILAGQPAITRLATRRRVHHAGARHAPRRRARVVQGAVCKTVYRGSIPLVASHSEHESAPSGAPSCILVATLVATAYLPRAHVTFASRNTAAARESGSSGWPWSAGAKHTTLLAGRRRTGPRPRPPAHQDEPSRDHRPGDVERVPARLRRASEVAKMNRGPALGSWCASYAGWVFTFRYLL